MKPNHGDLVCHLLVSPVIFYYFHPGGGQLFLMWGWFLTSLAFAIIFFINEDGFSLRAVALILNLTAMFIFSSLATFIAVSS